MKFKTKTESKINMMSYEQQMEFAGLARKAEVDQYSIDKNVNDIVPIRQLIESCPKYDYSSRKRRFVSQRKSELIKQKLDAWSKSLTAHGLPNIFRAKRRSIKILWSIFLMFSVAYCIYNIYSEISGYFHREYTTHLETVVETPTPYPTISICNVNPLITKQGEILVKKLFREEYGINLQNHSLTPNDLIEKLEFINLKARLHAFLPEYGDENRKLLGNLLEDTLIECFYNHHSCSHKDFDWYYSLNYGNCYQFNSGFNATGHAANIRQSYKPGAENGLSLMFFLGESNNRWETRIY